LIGIPITANIIQIIKHTVNDNVLMPTTDQALYCCVAIISSSSPFLDKQPAIFGRFIAKKVYSRHECKL